MSTVRELGGLKVSGVLDKLARKLKKLVDSSQGGIVVAMIVDEEGVPIASVGEGADALAACSSTIVGAVSIALSLLGESGFETLDVQLPDKSHLMIVSLSHCYLVLKTSQTPTLGLIRFLLRMYGNEIERLVQGHS